MSQGGFVKDIVSILKLENITISEKSVSRILKENTEDNARLPRHSLVLMKIDFNKSFTETENRQRQEEEEVDEFIAEDIKITKTEDKEKEDNIFFQETLNIIKNAVKEETQESTINIKSRYLRQ